MAIATTLIVYFLFISLRDEIVIQNMLLSIFTLCWIYVILIIPIGKENSKFFYEKYLKWAIPIFILQASLGFIQALAGFIGNGSFDLSNGDRVEGTVHLPLAASATFANVIFTYNLMGLILILVPHIFNKKRELIPYLFFGVIVLIMASVVHLILFFVIAIVLSFVLHRPNFRMGGWAWKWIGRFTLIAVPILAITLFPTNIQTARDLGPKILKFENPKAIVYKDLFVNLPQEYPNMPYIGIGPGNFSSRASLIGTGYYFGGFNDPIDLPLLEPKTSPATDKYIIPLWRWISELPWSAGSTLKPFSSWISTIGEFGLLVFLIIFGFIIKKVFMGIGVKNNEERLINFSVSAFWIFFFISGFQNNYWEVPQMFLSSMFGIIVLEKLRKID